MIEAWGRGFEIISNDFKNRGLEVPAFKEEFGGVTVIIKRENFSAIQHGQRMDSIKTRGETRGEILALLRSEPAVTASVMAERLGLTIKGIEWQLNRLRKEGVIAHRGSRKKGHWVVLTEEL